eukprot:3702935-Prorocentrum_lima.AAC.1
MYVADVSRHNSTGRLWSPPSFGEVQGKHWNLEAKWAKIFIPKPGPTASPTFWRQTMQEER